MADEPNRRGWQASFRDWIGAVALPIVFALLGFYQFYAKEVYWPATAINLTTDVTVKAVGLSAEATAEARNLEAIEVVITGRNPSSNTIYLCSNYWAAWGVKVGAREQSGDPSDEWPTVPFDEINTRKQYFTANHYIGKRYVGKHYKSSQKTLVAAGYAFTDSYLRAQEKVSATSVFYVPQGLYDLVEITVELPTTSTKHPTRPGGCSVKVEWRVEQDRFVESLAETKSDCTDEKVPYDEKGILPPKFLSDHGYQTAHSTVQLSLWQGKPSSRETAALRER